MPLQTFEEKHAVDLAFLQYLKGQRVSPASGPFDIARRSLLADCEAVLAADSKKRTWLRAAIRVLCHSPRGFWGEAEADFERSLKSRALTTGDGGLGAGTTGAVLLSEDVYSLVPRYGAFGTLAVIPLASGISKLAIVTDKPSAIWLTPANQGTAIPADAALTGNSISLECATLGALIAVSGEALGDGKTTFEGAILAAIVGGLAHRLDWSAFRADGTDDRDDGAMTGIFSDAAVPAASAAAGHTDIAKLVRADFIGTVAAVLPSALQRQCRWWISPDLLPMLMMLKDGTEYLLKPPTASGDEWSLIGFPVTWTAVAPSTDAAGEKIAAFGRGDAYVVGLRQEFEIMSSAGAKFQENLWQIRGIARARCMMRDSTSLATLKLADA